MGTPQLPSEDILAKLVLGFLEEEQLTKAHEEFLKECPHVNTQNQFDSVFMTTLKNVLKEYGKAKVLVKSCMPPELRQKLASMNLEEAVKFLLEHVDMERIRPESPSPPDECPICVEFMMEADPSIRTLSCSHRYHVPCIERWLERSPTCPYCRGRVD